MTELHLDTHAIVWLAGSQLRKFPANVRKALNVNALRYSPMARIELSFLHEIGRISEPAERLLDGLAEMVGLAEDSTSFGLVAHVAVGESFTRDLFDRLITAQALAAKARLVTKDETIRAAHPALTIWD